MHTKIQKWGNSLALRISRNIAERCHFLEGDEVDVIEHDGQIVISHTRPKVDIKKMISQITPENCHEEIDIGIVGKEVIEDDGLFIKNEKAKKK